MSILSTIGNAFKSLGGYLKRSISAAAVRGLTDSVIQMALVWVKSVALRTMSNDERRETVVGYLKNRGIPENIARIAVALAYELYKKEVGAIKKQSTVEILD